MANSSEVPSNASTVRATKATKKARVFVIAGALFAVLVLIAYSVLPLDDGPVTTASKVMFFFGVALLTAVVMWIAVTELRGNAVYSKRIRLLVLVMVIAASIVFFAQTYFRIAQSSGQFEELNTRLDSMYFTVTTAMTVGYGDVHAAGQVARFFVLINMVFNALVIGTAIKVVGFMTHQSRAQAATPASGEDQQ
ncbi:MAG: ion channel [Candidatus Nanopelagicales bacterium]